MPALTTILRIGVDEKGKPAFRMEIGALARMDREKLDELLSIFPEAMEQMVAQWEVARKEEY